MINKTALVSIEHIEQWIFLIRSKKVMLDFHLAELYGVETKALKRAVRRNKERFPEDFCFELTGEELKNLRYQFGTSSWGGQRYVPYVFTEQGVAMLSSVLRSKRAVQVNIDIMRAFVRLREILATHKELAGKLDELEKKYDKQFAIVFEAIRQLMTPPEKPKKQIGFKVSESKVQYKATKRQ
jgi:phage regulator Rha-like protein